MKQKKRIAFALATLSALAVMGGCDRDARKENEQVTTPAAVQPPTPTAASVDPAPQLASSTQPAAGPTVDAPAVSYLFFKEVPDPTQSQEGAVVDPSDYGDKIAFPRARIRLSGKGETHLTAYLYSDDPKEAIRRNWQGHRYSFRMPLRVASADHLDEADYRLKVNFVGADETSNGVYLTGDRFHLEPIDLSVRFESVGPKLVRLYIGGLFKQFDTTEVDAEPRWFHVRGIVDAAVD